MASVAFWTPVTYQPFVPSLGRRLLENVDAYFCLDGKKVCVIPEYQKGNSEGVMPFNEPASRTTLKVISYFTLIIPALVLIAKVVLRYIYKFHLIEQKEPFSNKPPFLGSSEAPPPSSPITTLPSNPTSYLLEYDRKYRMSFVEVARLFIRAPVLNRGHDWPQMDMPYYKLPPGVNLGFSALPSYQDSYFEYEYCKSISSGKLEIEVVRRKKGSYSDQEFLLVETHLTNERIIDLKLLPSSKGWAVSVREEFKGYIFSVTADDDGFWVQKILAVRDYPFLPFNQAVKLKEGDAQKLKIDHSERVGVSGWVAAYSNVPEYTNSVLLIKETETSVICVRMLKVELLF